MVRVVEQTIKIKKYFNQCPQCGREDEIIYKQSKDIICATCKNLNESREREARITKYRKMFDRLNKHFPNSFEFNECGTNTQGACILGDDFDLKTDDGITFQFNVYKDDGFIYLKLTNIKGAENEENSSTDGTASKR